MKNLKKIILAGLSVFLALVLVLFAMPNIAKATSGGPNKGTATINSGAPFQIVTISSSITFTVALTVGTNGIATDAANPTFTIPASFTTPDSTPVANPGFVVADGNWSAFAVGGTCAVTMGSSSATGNVITVDVTGACVAGNSIFLFYKGSAPATAVASATGVVTIKTAAVSGDGAATSIASSPSIIVKGTAAAANHAVAGVATTNNLVNTHLTGGTDLVLGGFNITATGENITFTNLDLNVTIANMTIEELTNLKIVPDNGTGGVANDGVMSALELASSPASTFASPVSGDNEVFIAGGIIVPAGSNKNYFIVGTLASSVSIGDTIAIQLVGTYYADTGVTSAVSITPTGTTTNSTMTVTDTTAPTISSITSNATASGALKVGDTILFTLTPGATEAGATVAGSYNGQSLTWSTADAGVTYTATYTVIEGDTNQSTALQISGVVITDEASNPSSAGAGTDVVKTIDANSPSAPVAIPIAGTYTGAQSVILTSAGSDSIHYTTTGTADCSSTLYTTAISISLSETISAIGCDTAGNASSAVSFAYVINISHSGGGGQYIITSTILNTTSPTISTSTSVISKITLYLYYGATGSPVRTIQQFLISQNKGPSARALAFHGTTTYFGSLTKSALAEWQKAVGVAPAYGNFGPITRAYIKSHNF